MLIDAHRSFLDDPARMDCFSRAVAETVRPGDVVADLGSGTGILGLMACRAGASRVYSVERTPMTSLARRIASANGFSGRVIALQGLSTRVDVPEPVDVVLSDMIGHIGFLAGGAESLIDARMRWLKPGGRLMPAAVETWIAPVEQPEYYRQVDFWSTPIDGFDMSCVRQSAANTGYPNELNPEGFLAPAVAAVRCDYHVDDAEVARGASRFVVTRAGTMHGVGAWFVAQLSPSVRMTNRPGAPDRIQRRNAFLPLEQPVAVIAGDEVTIALTIRPIDFVVSWSVTVRRDEVVLADFRQSTLRGMLIAREDLVSYRQGSRPVLNRWAAARASTLELCDGQRELGEIERLVYERHPALFTSALQAQVFVAEVVSRYANSAPRT
jgi:protein arginine N-methyltransferase 1